MSCYFQEYTERGVTKEHIPPRAFFPDGEKDQLLTVKSCPKHNNAKSKDDLYVLAQTCMHASPNNRVRDIFLNKVASQLDLNNGALRKKLAQGSVAMVNGAVRYQVEVGRLDDFFTALSCGIIYKACGTPLPEDYGISHIYHNFQRNSDEETLAIQDAIGSFYNETPMSFMEFGDPDTKNERIYTVMTFGIPGFLSSITMVHRFFGVFKVTSMLTKLIGDGTST